MDNARCLQILSQLETAATTAGITDYAMFKAKVAAMCSVSDEDRRQAAGMAADAAQALIQIAVAVLVAILAFGQFGLEQDDEIRVLPAALLAGSALLCVVSMCSGFVAIGGIYKRGEGRGNGDASWSTAKASGSLHAQSYTGLVALVAFAAAVGVWRWEAVDTGGQTIVELPSGPLVASRDAGAIEITGEWSAMSIRQGEQFELDLPPTKPGETSSVRLRFE